MGFELTKEQQSVVDDRGGALLVSAAAGSGKTRVLVERLLDRVEREQLNVDRFLVITYTKAAAAELRSRIVAELGDRLAQHPEDGHLRRQMTLVYKAQISTIHAFCAQLMREQGHLLDLHPDARLMDEKEAGLMMLEVLDGVLDAHYEDIEEGSDFEQLLDTMSAGRDDSRLVQIVMDIRGKVQSHPRPEEWLQEQSRRFDLTGITDAGETIWGRAILEDARRQAEYLAGQMEEALDLASFDEVFELNYGESLRTTWDGLLDFRDRAAEGWDAAYAALPIPFPTAGRKRGAAEISETERAKLLRTRCKKQSEKLEALFEGDSAEVLEGMRLAAPAMQGLFALVQEFEAAYTAEKARRGVVDFSDLEHTAVRLLTGPEGPTELAHDLSRRYDEIMVDEYQDTNEVQNEIFSAISRNGENLFLVGDVKQSIYRFRLADPTIFLEKYRTFTPADRAEKGEPRRIILSKNFRSRVQVLEAANFLFRNLMSVEMGEMDYTADEALYPGPGFPETGDHRVELDVLDLSDKGAEEEGKTSRDQLEARCAARRIEALLREKAPVSDGAGGTRPVKPGDIVILLRSPGVVLHHYARALSERGLTWEAEGGGEFFDSTEVNVVLSMLQVIDNPRQDVPLISVLRSPVYGFTADQLALLRAGCRNGDFYEAVKAGAEAGDAACADFLRELSDLRFGSGDKSCYQLLWDLYDRANLLGVFGAMPGGEERQGNLMLLAELARKFEGAGHKGLFGFLTYLTRLQEQGTRITAPSVQGESGGVRILSIHRSKGLEFPVVLLCGLMRRLNREDMKKPVLFHPKMGVGPKWLDRECMVESPTLARRAVARQLESEIMAEELRLLYVAVTRAKDKLILSVALTGGAKDLTRLSVDSDCPVEPQALKACQSVGEWVLLPVLARPEAKDLRTAAGVSRPPVMAEWGPEWDIRWLRDEETEESGGPRPNAENNAPAAEEETEEDAELARTLFWTYPHAADVELPSKLTATQLKGRGLDEEAAEGSGPAPGNTPAPVRPFRRPRFAQEELGLTPTQRGTAHHLVMQYIDFAHTGSLAQVNREIERLVREEFLTPEQGKAVDAEHIYAFFSSPLGRELRGADTLRREFKFSILVPAQRYAPTAGEGEQMLLQGVVDCFFETLEGVTVVDFKTDHVHGKYLLERAEGYRPQLMAYSEALEEILGRPVIRRVLWFFSEDRAVDL